jgi:hypothetical protein
VTFERKGVKVTVEDADSDSVAKLKQALDEE